ncbi:TPM domain-containing protein [Candidatus Peregrinibacteria bacterium]|nr:TPM domain-containing protein [Candidatus Peregrinibacteria bacterium]
MMRLILSSLLLTLVVPFAYAFEAPPNDGFVTDTAGVLTPEQEADLEEKLRIYREQTSNEIAILIVPSLQGEEIADVAVEIGRAWGIGDDDNNNGILLLMSYEDRAFFLATGYGLEGAIPDVVAKGIVETDILPHFREGRYYEGFIAGLEAIRKHVGGEYTAERYAVQEDGSWLVSLLLFSFFVFLQWGFAIMARTKSWWLGGVFGGALGVILTFIFSFWYSIPILVLLGLFLDYVVSKNYQSHAKTKWWAGGGWGPGGGGGGGRGGFGGFGGGSFGGGGAGGKW